MATTVLNQAISQSNTEMLNTVRIPSNNANGNPLTLTYSTPLNTNGSTGSITSTFPAILGSTSGQSGLVNTLYTAIQSFNTKVNDIKTNAQTFNTNRAALDSGFSSVVNASTSLRTSVSSGFGSTNQYLTDSSTEIDRTKITVPIFWGLLISLAVVCGLAALCAYSNKSQCCRYIMYFSCFFITIWALSAFLGSFILSIWVPYSAWGCQYSQ